MKIVLLALYDVRSYGIRILHACLKKNGYDVVSIFFNEDMNSGRYSEADLNFLVQTIKSEHPNLIGIGFRSPLFQLYIKLTRKIKKNVDSLILAGGHHPTIAPDECIKYADIVCIGEGEYPLLELCQKLTNGDSIESIDNLWINTPDGIVKNKLRPLIKNLDEIPFPDYSNDDKIYLLKNKRVDDLGGLRSRKEMSVITTRGCYFRCSFCYNAQLKKIYERNQRYVRRRSVNNVLEEIQILKKQFPHLAYIYFSDNVFTYNKAWIEEFCKRYKEEVNLPFGCFSHFAMIDKTMISLLMNAGLRDITLGIQSGSYYIAKEIYNRNIKPQKIIDSAKIIAQSGVTPYYDLITNNPYETDTTHRETLDLLLKLQPPFHLRTFKMKYFPRVPFTQKLLEDGLIGECDIESNRESMFEKWMDPIGITKGKSNQELFWDCIYVMVQERFPAPFIRSIAISSFLRENPVFIAIFLKYLFLKPKSALKYLWKAFLYICRGEVGLLMIKIKKKFQKFSIGKGWGY